MAHPKSSSFFWSPHWLNRQYINFLSLDLEARIKCITLMRIFTVGCVWHWQVFVNGVFKVQQMVKSNRANMDNLSFLLVQKHCIHIRYELFIYTYSIYSILYMCSIHFRTYELSQWPLCAPAGPCSSVPATNPQRVTNVLHR